MTQTASTPSSTTDTSAPLVVVSADSHIGPLPQDLRRHCPVRYLDDFDAFMAVAAEHTGTIGPMDPDERPGQIRRGILNLKTAGHHDMRARLRDMDSDGIAAQVIFHGSQNMAPFPMNSFSSLGGRPDTEPELTAVGVHIYNEWLAEACSIESERHIGLVHIPTWDVEASIREVEWARRAGLRGVNWPAPRLSMPEFDEPVWEPFWSACESLDMSLNTHCGAAIPGGTTSQRPHGKAMFVLESGGWPSRRGVGRMIFGGVFERHPGLKLVVTEVPGVWWPYEMNEMDTIWLHNDAPAFRAQLPKRPSEYFRSNVFIGASFMAHFEAEAAVREDLVGNLLWGSDYPHREGTWAYPDRDDELPRGRLALRDAFSGIPPDAVARMLGENAVDVYGLDRPALAAVAGRIDAPTLDELAAPLTGAELDEVQAALDQSRDYTHAFRTIGTWY